MRKSNELNFELNNRIQAQSLQIVCVCVCVAHCVLQLIIVGVPVRAAIYAYNTYTLNMKYGIFMFTNPIRAAYVRAINSEHERKTVCNPRQSRIANEEDSAHLCGWNGIKIDRNRGKHIGMDQVNCSYGFYANFEATEQDARENYSLAIYNSSSLHANYGTLSAREQCVTLKHTSTGA